MYRVYVFLELLDCSDDVNACSFYGRALLLGVRARLAFKDSAFVANIARTHAHGQGLVEIVELERVLDLKHSFAELAQVHFAIVANHQNSLGVFPQKIAGLLNRDGLRWTRPVISKEFASKPALDIHPVSKIHLGGIDNEGFIYAKLFSCRKHDIKLAHSCLGWEDNNC